MKRSRGNPPEITAVQQYVLDHLDLVEPIAHEYRRKLPLTFELSDLIQSGRLGLCKAANTFTPHVGPSGDGGASQWARICIRGAIRDTVKRKNYHYSAARVGLEFDGDPGRRDIQEWLRGNAQVAPIDDGRLLAAVENLTPRQRKLIDLLYAQACSVNEVAKNKLIGLSRPGVRREHHKALVSLRDVLDQANTLEP